MRGGPPLGLHLLMGASTYSRLLSPAPPLRYIQP
jgi:hypothetical protein